MGGGIFPGSSCFDLNFLPFSGFPSFSPGQYTEPLLQCRQDNIVGQSVSVWSDILSDLTRWRQMNPWVTVKSMQTNMWSPSIGAQTGASHHVTNSWPMCGILTNIWGTHLPSMPSHTFGQGAVYVELLLQLEAQKRTDNPRTRDGFWQNQQIPLMLLHIHYSNSL